MKVITYFLNNKVLEEHKIQNDREFPEKGDLIRLKDALYIVRERMWELDWLPEYRTIHLDVEIAPDVEERRKCLWKAKAEKHQETLKKIVQVMLDEDAAEGS